MLRDIAPAKVNLSLGIPGRFEDGYHAIDSVVAFAGSVEAADTLGLHPDRPLSLSITGDPSAPTDDSNLVLRAARAFEESYPGCRTGAFTLEKRLPVAAGIGGGSSDAAAALRLLATLNDITDLRRLRAIAVPLGADVPVCIAARAQHMAGIGEIVTPLPGFPDLPTVLVNPGLAVPTADVFDALGLETGTLRRHGIGPAQLELIDRNDVLAYLNERPNDMQDAAVKLCPEIANCIDFVSESGALTARMSGSGATVFGVYEDEAAARHAANIIVAAQPGWWVVGTMLR